jgi:cell pole-organizing protein PopZ
MEDILASIRRILSEDENPPRAAAAAPGPLITPPPAPPPAPPALHEVEPDLEDDTLQLDMTMMLPDEPRAAMPPARPMSDLEDDFSPPPLPTPPTESLVAPETAAVASSAIASLMSTLASERGAVVYRGGPTIEDLVREEMRPLLKHWLDMHLPPLVERLVRAEIERVVNRASR